MECWVVPDEGHKGNPEKFLNYIESTLDNKISPEVCVYELEDVRKRSDESIDELIDRICQLAHCAQIGNGSDATIEFEVQGRLIRVIPDANIKLQKELLKMNCDKKVSDLLEISHTYYAIESGVAAMCASKAIHALHQGHQPQKSKQEKCTPQCPNCTHSHSPGCDNCPAWNATYNGCSKRGHWHAKWCSSGAVGKDATKPDGAVKAPHHQDRGKGKTADIVQVSTKETSPCDKLFANTVDYGSAGDTHPEEIVINDICAPRCNEAYTMIKLPASISSKGTALLNVKVDTGAGDNVFPLCVFQCLHPDWISPADLPTGLDHISTWLTAYNRSHIPLYGALCGPIIWQPGGPGIQPGKINSYWYIADTPGPAILGLLLCKGLAIVKMNCAITVMQPSTKPQSPAPASTTATKVKPATVPTAAKSIRSTDDLIKEFPDQFMGIGRFLTQTQCPSHDTCPQEMPHCFAPKGQGTPQQDGMPGSDYPCR